MSKEKCVKRKEKENCSENSIYLGNYLEEGELIALSFACHFSDSCLSNPISSCWKIEEAEANLIFIHTSSFSWTTLSYHEMIRIRIYDLESGLFF